LFMELGKYDDALKDYNESLAIRTHLSELDPLNAVWQSSLAVIRGEIGMLFTRQGRLEDALEQFNKALEIDQRLSALRPTNATWQYAVADSFDKIGGVLLWQRKFDEAIKSERDGIAILDRLVKSNSGVAAWQWKLSTLYDQVGLALGSQGKFDDALTNYRDGLAIRKSLARSNPGEATWGYEVSTSLGKIGDVFKAQGKLVNALNSYRAALSIRAQFAEAAHDNVQWQFDLSRSYYQIADLLLTQNNVDEAFDNFKNGLPITVEHVSSDPAHMGWKADLQNIAGAVNGVAFRFLLLGQFDRALEAVNIAVERAPDQTIFLANKALALMFLGRSDEARSIFDRYHAGPDASAANGWDAVILKDFSDLRNAGRTNPLMDEIEKRFSDKSLDALIGKIDSASREFSEMRTLMPYFDKPLMDGFDHRKKSGPDFPWWYGPYKHVSMHTVERSDRDVSEIVEMGDKESGSDYVIEYVLTGGPGLWKIFDVKDLPSHQDSPSRKVESLRGWLGLK
jgi:tetratricopeptide (TPR) repeat protein